MTVKTTSGLDIIIRREEPKDYPDVHDLVYEAFATKGDLTVAEYLDNIREKDAFMPDLAFVATLVSGKIVGQITLYHTDIITDDGKITQLVLSPISVLPKYFKRGIARAMITHALNAAKEMGYSAVFLQGNPKFYEKFGFVPAYKHGVYHIKDSARNAQYCMVNVLKPGALIGITGMTDYE